MNLANIITTLRLFLIPVYVTVFFSDLEYSFPISMIIYLISGITDILDGYVARKYNLISKYGTVLDPLADKLTLITVLLSLYIKDYIPIVVLAFVLLKETVMIIGGIFLYKKDLVIPSNNYGKFTTVLFFLGIISLIFSEVLSNLFLYLGIIFAILSFSIYFKLFIRSNA